MVIPIFQKPFAEEFPAGNLFDHDLPFEFRDTNGFTLDAWNERTNGIDGHDGYDWTMPEGTPLLAVADGEVVTAGAFPVSQESCPLVQNPSPLNYVEIRHATPDGFHFSSEYLHLSRIDVQKGDVVTAGQPIGLSGNTGCSTDPHLHFSVRRWEQTNNGRHVRIDPYGWAGPDTDPWSVHPQGAASAWLWKEGQAPVIFRQRRLAPNPGPRDSAAVAITLVRYMGYDDAHNPNNEFVELTLDPRFATTPNVTLTGVTLTTNAGESFAFPAGFVIREGTPVRIFTGPGENTDTELYWGRDAGVWDNTGDCAHPVRPNGTNLYRLAYFVQCR